MIGNANFSHTARTILSFVFLATLAGCSTLEPVAVNPEAIQTKVAIGDRLEYVTAAGDTADVTVSELTEFGIAVQDDMGQRREVAYAELANLYLRRPAKGRTVGLALGIAAAIAAIQFSSGEDFLTFPGAPTGL